MLPGAITSLISMSKLRIVIIEDEFFAASHLQALLHALGYEVEAVYYNAEDFLRKTRWQFDAAIVDIFLSGTLNGLHLAEKLNERLKPFLFLTANEDTQTLKNAARLNPRAYISKPFKENDVKVALEMIALNRMQTIPIRGSQGVEQLHPGNILFIRSDGAYVEIVTLETKLVQRKLLREIEQELPPAFVRVHRSYIVNTDFIDQRSASMLSIRGHEIPVSRQFRHLL